MPVVAWSNDRRGRLVDDRKGMHVFRGGRVVSILASEMQPGDLGPCGQGRYDTMQAAWRDGVTLELIPITRVQRFA